MPFDIIDDLQRKGWLGPESGDQTRSDQDFGGGQGAPLSPSGREMIVQPSGRSYARARRTPGQELRAMIDAKKWDLPAGDDEMMAFSREYGLGMDGDAAVNLGDKILSELAEKFFQDPSPEMQAYGEYGHQQFLRDLAHGKVEKITGFDEEQYASSRNAALATVLKSMKSESDLGMAEPLDMASLVEKFAAKSEYFNGDLVQTYAGDIDFLHKKAISELFGSKGMTKRDIRIRRLAMNMAMRGTMNEDGTVKPEDIPGVSAKGARAMAKYLIWKKLKGSDFEIPEDSDADESMVQFYKEAKQGLSGDEMYELERALEADDEFYAQRKAAKEAGILEDTGKPFGLELPSLLGGKGAGQWMNLAAIRMGSALTMGATSPEVLHYLNPETHADPAIFEEAYAMRGTAGKTGIALLELFAMLTPGGAAGKVTNTFRGAALGELKKKFIRGAIKEGKTLLEAEMLIAPGTKALHALEQRASNSAMTLMMGTYAGVRTKTAGGSWLETMQAMGLSSGMGALGTTGADFLVKTMSNSKMPVFFRRLIGESAAELVTNVGMLSATGGIQEEDIWAGVIATLLFGSQIGAGEHMRAKFDAMIEGTGTTSDKIRMAAAAKDRLVQAVAGDLPLPPEDAAMLSRLATENPEAAKALKTQAIDLKTNNFLLNFRHQEEGEITSMEDFRHKAITFLGEERAKEADAVVAVLKARAESVGVSPDEYVRTRLADVVIGGGDDVTGEVLYQRQKVAGLLRADAPLEARKALVEAPVPKVLEQAGLGGVSDMEWVKASKDPDVPHIGIPGGMKGLDDDSTFTLWDMWRIQAQAIDPSRIDPNVYRKIIAKFGRTHQRSLETDPLDTINRAAFGMLSPQTELAANEAMYQMIRMRNEDDVKKMAGWYRRALKKYGQAEALRKAGRMMQESLGIESYDKVPKLDADGNPVMKVNKKTGKEEVVMVDDTTTGGKHTADTGFLRNTTVGKNLGGIAYMAHLYTQHPEFFVKQPHEETDVYITRLASVLKQAGYKTMNFAAMIGAPMYHPIGTIDTHIAQILSNGRLKEAPEASSVQYRYANGDIHPMFRDNPLPAWAEAALSDGKITVYGGEYEKMDTALSRMRKGKDKKISQGLFQWFKWDIKRGKAESHHSQFPGSYAIPGRMRIESRIKAQQVQHAQGAYARGPQNFDAADPRRIFMYQDAEGGPKGSVEFLKDGRAVIRGLEGRDFSTLMHEIGHVFRRDLEQTSKTDHAIATKWATGKADGTWDTAAEEKFSRAFERWLRNGVAPTPGLKKVFASMKRWLTNIYKYIKGSEIDVKMTPEIRGVFERMLTPGEHAELVTDVSKRPDSMREPITGEVPNRNLIHASLETIGAERVSVDEIVGQGFEVTPGYDTYVEAQGMFLGVEDVIATGKRVEFITEGGPVRPDEIMSWASDSTAETSASQPTNVQDRRKGDRRVRDVGPSGEERRLEDRRRANLDERDRSDNDGKMSENARLWEKTAKESIQAEIDAMAHPGERTTPPAPNSGDGQVRAPGARVPHPDGGPVPLPPTGESPSFRLNESMEGVKDPLEGDSAGQHEVHNALDAAVVQDTPTAPPTRVGRTQKKPFAKRVRAQWHRWAHTRRIMEANDLRGAGHESGHAVQEQFFLEMGPPTEAMARDLDELGMRQLTKPGNYGYWNEGFAEGMYLWAFDPEVGNKMAPDLMKAIDAWVGKSKKRAKAWAQVRRVGTLYRNQNPFLRAKNNIEFITAHSQLLSAVKAFWGRQQWIDKAAPLSDMVELGTHMARKHGQLGWHEALPPEMNPYVTFRALQKTAGGVAEHMIENGINSPIDQSPITKHGLKRAMEIVGDRDYEFTVFLYALRSRERIAHARRTTNYAGDGRDLVGMSAKEADSIIKFVEASEFANKFSDASAIVHDFMDGLLTYMRDWGALPDELRARVMGNSSHFIPLERVWDTEVDPSMFVQSMSGGNPIKHFKGSGRRIRDPFAVMEERVRQMVEIAHRQAVRQSIVEFSKFAPGLGKFVEEVPIETTMLAEGILDKFKGQLKNQGLDIDKMNTMRLQEYDRMNSLSDDALVAEVMAAWKMDRAKGYHNAKSARNRARWEDRQGPVPIHKRGPAQGRRRTPLPDNMEQTTYVPDGKKNKKTELHVDLMEDSSLLVRLEGRDALIEYAMQVRGTPTEDPHNMLIQFFAPRSIDTTKDPIMPVTMPDGTRKWFQVSPSVMKALNGIETHLPQWLRIMSAPTRAFRASVTSLNPGFAALTNPIRDAGTYALQSQSMNPAELASSYATEAIHAVGEALAGRLLGVKGSFFANLFKSLGGGAGTHSIDAMQFSGGARSRIAGSAVPSEGILRAPLKALNEAGVRARRMGKEYIEVLRIAGANIRTARNPVQVMGALINAGVGLSANTMRPMGSFLRGVGETFNASEVVPRAAEMAMSLRRSGWEPGSKISKGQIIEALYRSKTVTVDFSSGGFYAEIINQFVPFFNVGFQGPKAFLDAMKNIPPVVSATGVARGLASVFAHEQVKDLPFWDELDPEERYRYLYIPVGAGEVIRIPLNQEVGPLFHALPTLALEIMQGTMDEGDLEGFWSSVLEGYVPFVEGSFYRAMREGKQTGDWRRAILSLKHPIIYKPIAEILMNYAGFQGREIEGKYMKSLPPEERYTDFSTGIAKWLGGDATTRERDHFLFSPVQWDHLIKGYGGQTAYDIALIFGQSDAMSKGFQDRGVFEMMTRRVMVRGGTTGSHSHSLDKLNDELQVLSENASSRVLVETDDLKRRRLALEFAQTRALHLLRGMKELPTEAERRAATAEIRRMVKLALRNGGSMAHEARRQAESAIFGAQQGVEEQMKEIRTLQQRLGR